MDKRIVNKTNKSNKATDCYRPIPFDPKMSAAKKRKNSAAFREAYDAMKEGIKTLGTLLVTRHG